MTDHAEKNTMDVISSFVTQYVLRLVYEMAPVKVDEQYLDISLTNHLGFDSITLIELIVHIEKKFNIHVDPDAMLLDNFDTPRAIVTLVSNILNKKIKSSDKCEETSKED